MAERRGDLRGALICRSVHFATAINSCLERQEQRPQSSGVRGTLEDLAYCQRAANPGLLPGKRGGDSRAECSNRADAVPLDSKTISLREIVGGCSGAHGLIRQDPLIESTPGGAKHDDRDGYKSRCADQIEEPSRRLWSAVAAEQQTQQLPDRITDPLQEPVYKGWRLVQRAVTRLGQHVMQSLLCKLGVGGAGRLVERCQKRNHARPSVHVIRRLVPEVEKDLWLGLAGAALQRADRLAPCSVAGRRDPDKVVSVLDCVTVRVR